jgi:hypothetical protein
MRRAPVDRGERGDGARKLRVQCIIRERLGAHLPAVVIPGVQRNLMTGAVGKSKRRMTTPTSARPNMTNRSNELWRMPYTPTVAKIRMPAYSGALGIFSSLTHRPTMGRFSTSSMTLPM